MLRAQRRGAHHGTAAAPRLRYVTEAAAAQVPAVRFSYEILPLVVHKAEARPAVYHFATQLCAIVGGCARHAAPSVRVQRRGGWCVCGGGGGVLVGGLV